MCMCLAELLPSLLSVTVLCLVKVRESFRPVYEKLYRVESEVDPRV